MRSPESRRHGFSRGAEAPLLHHIKGNRRTGLIAATSIAGAIGFLAMPGFVSAGPPTVRPIIVNPTVPPTPPPPRCRRSSSTRRSRSRRLPNDIAQPEFPGSDDPRPTPPTQRTPPTRRTRRTRPTPANLANPATPAPQAAPTGQLPETGVDSTLFVVLGVALTLGGSAIVTMARRKADVPAS